mmetsp:Transcript_19497/g.54920  ORF Transcript_19497/g.54920 Transcript_19497/m.54920 type:complete len:245 (+) Transcript_19497:133-867(+)
MKPTGKRPIETPLIASEALARTSMRATQAKRQPHRAGGRCPRSLQELGEPLEAFCVARLQTDAAHEHLNWPDARVLGAALDVLAVGVHKAQLGAQLAVAGGSLDVNLVAKHKDGHVRKGLVAQQAVQLELRLREARAIVRVHDVHDAVGRRVVRLPHLARALVAAQVVRAELNVVNDQLLRRRMARGLCCRHALVLQHGQQRGLPGIVKTKEQQVGLLVTQSKVVQDAPKPVHEEHGCRASARR